MMMWRRKEVSTSFLLHSRHDGATADQVINSPDLLSNWCLFTWEELVPPEAVRWKAVVPLLLSSHLLTCPDTSLLSLSHTAPIHRACGGPAKWHDEGDGHVWADGCGGALQGWMDCEGPHPASHSQIQETSGAGTLREPPH